MPDAAELLAAYDAQLRAHVPRRLPPRVTVERDGPVVRFFGLGGRGFVVYRDLGGLEGVELDELIARQVRAFAQRGERFEWKLHEHDRPADLPRRLPGRVLVRGHRSARSRPDRGAGADDLGQRHGWLAESLESEREADPDGLAIVVAEAGSGVVCAGWVRFGRGTDFATLWGGATLPAWRGRGIYRATVAYRANLAAERGLRFLEVDASSDSRPILERLGFIPVTTTTPYVWSPP